MQATLQGRVCLVTGATSGMGKATAAALARQGATVILVARDQRRGEQTRDEIRASSGNPRVELLLADLSSQAAIHGLVAAFKQRHRELHVLVNNAGGLFFERQTTQEGLEMTFAVNHMAYFLLTNLLLDVLTASAPARIINIASNAESAGRIDFDDLQHARRRPFNSFNAYAQSKLANLLFTYELAGRLQGSGVTVNAVRPGPVATNFGAGGRGLFRLFPLIFRTIGQSAEQGAQTAIYLASSPEVEGVTGKVFYHCKEVQPSHQARDVALQQRLWQASEELIAAPVLNV
ncbi:MAG: SDR family oxidoreductase [Roseiflexaceae bacterium]